MTGRNRIIYEKMVAKHQAKKKWLYYIINLLLTSIMLFVIGFLLNKVKSIEFATQSHQALYTIIHATNIKDAFTQISLKQAVYLTTLFSLLYLVLLFIIYSIARRYYYLSYKIKAHFAKPLLFAELTSQNSKDYSAKDIKYIVERLAKYQALTELWQIKNTLRVDFSLAYPIFIDAFKDDDIKLLTIYSETIDYKQNVLDLWLKNNNHEMLWAVRTSAGQIIYPYFIQNLPQDDDKMRTIYHESDANKPQIIEIWKANSKMELLWDARFMSDNSVYKLLIEHFKHDKERLAIIYNESEYCKAEIDKLTDT
ncbi:MAG TPA: hypothetical protein PKZ69_01565 [Candidatus Cloacimonadota bacterium]|nr:hypothetical protein [Candidatus Cloacimonadota bacterium]